MNKISSYEKKVLIFLLSLATLLLATTAYLNARDAVDLKVLKIEKNSGGITP